MPTESLNDFLYVNGLNEKQIISCRDTSYLSIFDVNLFNYFAFPEDNWLKIVLNSFSSNKAHNVSSWIKTPRMENGCL